MGALAVLLPFLLLVYGVGSFVAYAFWCENMRGVDPGLGDAWVVPLADGCRFEMIDSPDEADVDDRTGRQLLSGIRRLDSAGHVVAAESSGTFYVVDTRSRTTSIVGSESAALAALAGAGAHQPRLVDCQEFYRRRRWTWADLAAAVLIVLPPAVAVLLLTGAFRRSIRRQGA